MAEWSSTDYDDLTPKQVFLIKTLVGAIGGGVVLATVLQGFIFVVSLFQK